MADDSGPLTVLAPYPLSCKLRDPARQPVTFANMDNCSRWVSDDVEFLVSEPLQERLFSRLGALFWSWGIYSRGVSSNRRIDPRHCVRVLDLRASASNSR